MILKKRILPLVMAFFVGFGALAGYTAATADASTTTTTAATSEEALLKTTQFQENMTFLKLLNADRIANEATPLAVTEELMEASAIRAKEMETEAGDTRPDGSYWFTALGDTDAIAKSTLNAIIYFSVSEYYAYEMYAGGTKDVTAVYNAFKSKSSNSAIMNRTNLTHIGLAHNTEGKTVINEKECTDPWNLMLVDKYHPVADSIEVLNVSDKEYPAGSSISDMGIVLKIKFRSPEKSANSADATPAYKEYVGYLPVIDSMCSGFSVTNYGKQTVTVTYKNTAIDMDNSKDSLNTTLSTTFVVDLVEPADPAIPTNFKAVGDGYNKVKCTWSPAENAKQYKIYRSTSNNKDYKLIATLNASDLQLSDDNLYTYTDKNSGDNKLTHGKTYYYKISSVNITKESDKTAYDAGKPIVAAPTGLKSTKKTKSSITIKWSSVSGASKYRVYYSTKKSSGYKYKTTSKKSYTIKSLKKNKKYYIRLKAYRGGKYSSYSKTITVTTKNK